MNKGSHKKFECDICGKMYANKARVKFHIKNYHQQATESTVCAQCDGRFATASSLKKHVERVHSQRKELFCTIDGCNSSFYTKKDRTDHMRKKHRLNILHCENCNKEFAYERNLKRHILRCGKAIKKDHTCKFCTKQYRSPEALAMHEKSKHTQVKQFVCDVCGKIFDRNFSCARHVRTVHQLD